jgi:cell wall-associated NlpC family hydrolase
MDWWGRYIGTPYADLHCWGLVRRVYADQLGIDLPAYADIPPGDHRAVIGAMRAGAEGWVAADGTRPFDVVLMRRHRLALHVGVITRPGWLLHTEAETDAVHEALSAPGIAGRITGFRRLPE